MKTLITGITGQDGSYLAEKLLTQGHEVHGIIRRSSSFNTGRIDHIFDKLHLHYGDITDSLNIDDIINKVKPDRIYNLAAQSHVQISFSLPLYTAQTDALGTLIILEAVRKHCSKCRIYNATTSELFGLVQEIPQKETTKMYPRSPYGVAKLYSFWISKNYRESYGMFISNGILFNHESERRGGNFVTKKITNGLVNWYKTGESIKLGFLDAKRDWGYAPEYCDAMMKIIEHSEPDDFVIATGEAHSNREFIEEAFQYLEKGKLTWIGSGVNEKGVDENGKVVIEVDKKYFRPAEVDLLLGDASKAKNLLGWEAKTHFNDLIKIMMKHDLGDIIERDKENKNWDDYRQSMYDGWKKNNPDL
jgi:GDPmannose 4,6-dehydratase